MIGFVTFTFEMCKLNFNCCQTRNLYQFSSENVMAVVFQANKYFLKGGLPCCNLNMRERYNDKFQFVVSFPPYLRVFYCKQAGRLLLLISTHVVGFRVFGRGGPFRFQGKVIFVNCLRSNEGLFEHLEYLGYSWDVLIFWKATGAGGIITSFMDGEGRMIF